MTPREHRPTRLRTPRSAGESTRTLRGALRVDGPGLSTFSHRKTPSLFRGGLLLGIVVGAIALAVFLAGSGDRPATGDPDANTATEVVSAEDRPAAPTGPPTPYFASYRSMRLSLPVAPDEVTLLAFHQASGSKALEMDSLAPDTDMEELAERVQDKDYVTSAELAEENGSCDGSVSLWQGEVLRLWRSGRRGPPTTAADVGAAPGAEVRAPITGTVIAVRPYELYGTWDDYEIHIQPEGWPEVDVVLIHVTDVRVEEGDQVVGGLTPIAAVRGLSDKVDLQLSGYTPDGGDHVHLQLNELPDPAMLEFIGDS